MLKIVLVLASILMLGACSDIPDDCSPSCSFSGAASATLGGGTSQTGFLNLSNGDEMTVTIGPQGLYMVTPSIRVANMDPGQTGQRTDCEPEVLIQIYKDSDLIGGSAREHIGLVQGASGSEALGVFAPFTAQDVSGYIDSIITLRAEVNDVCGRSASDELEVVAVVR